MVMGQTEKLQTVLESLLVEEFRTVQKLQQLKLSESQALSDYDMDTVFKLDEEIEVTIDTIHQLQSQRQVVVEKITNEQKRTSDDLAMLYGPDELYPELHDRILRLQEGIRAVNDEIRQISTRNAAMTPPIMKKPRELRDLPS